MLQFLVDKHGFVFKTFDDKKEAVSEYKRFYKAGYDVYLENLEEHIMYKQADNIKKTRNIS